MTVGLTVAAVLVGLDQLTKVLAERLLEPGRFVPMLGDRIGWQLVYNPGGAFGLPAPAWIFLVVTVVVIVVVARILPRTSSSWQAAAYGLLLAGAIGNVIDRLVRDGGPGRPAVGGGEVVDFVAWGSFPRFNVADSAITVGFVLLVLTLWWEERRVASQEAPAGADRAAADGRTDAADPADRDGTSDVAGRADEPIASDHAENADHVDGADPPDRS